jgi:hypothetical protein
LTSKTKKAVKATVLVKKFGTMQKIVLTLIIAFTTFTVVVSCFQVPAASAADIG